VRVIGWAVYSAISAALMVIFFVLSSIAFGQGLSALTLYGGLLQRLALGVGFTWLTILAAGLSLGLHRSNGQVGDGVDQ